MAYHRSQRKILGKAGAFLPLCAASLPVHAQTLGLAPVHEVSPWRVIGALLFCCVLGAAGAFALWYRTRGQALVGRNAKPVTWRNLIANFGAKTKVDDEGAGRLRLVGTVRLGYQVDVNLLDCDGKSVVIVTSPHGAFVADPDAPHGVGRPS